MRWRGCLAARGWVRVQLPFRGMGRKLSMNEELGMDCRRGLTGSSARGGGGGGKGAGLVYAQDGVGAEGEVWGR